MHDMTDTTADVEGDIAVLLDLPPYDADAERSYFEQIAPNIQRALAAGNRVTLLRKTDKGSKTPLVGGFNDSTRNNWNLDELRGQLEWAIGKRFELAGYGICNGEISGHRYVLDFDRGDFYEPIRKKVLAETGYDLADLPRVRSGRTSSIGYHLPFRSTQSFRSQYPAFYASEDQHQTGETKYRAIVELKGEGGHCVGPGSRHDSGNLYTIEHGDPFAPPIISAETVDKIIEAISTFDERPKKEPPPKKEPRPATFQPITHTTGNTYTALDVIAEFNRRNSTDDVLTRHGYRHVGGDFYRHPNRGESEASVHLLDHGAQFFSPNDPMAQHGITNNAGTFGDAFEIEAALAYAGDKNRAIRELSEMYGMRSQKASDLPATWESNADEYIKPLTQKKTQRPAIEIDLHDFPEPVRNLVNALSAGNHILPPILHLGAAYAVLGAIIGKRASCENHANLIYPNYSAVMLIASAQNKTGTLRPLQDAFVTQAIQQLVPTSTMPAMYDVMGVSLPKKQFSNMTTDELRVFKTTSLEAARRKKDGYIILADECTNDLKSLLGSYDAKNPSKDIENVLKLFDGGGFFQKQLATEGYKMIGDACVTLCGFSQCTTWEKTLGDSDSLSRGLFGRFVPYTTTHLRLEGVQVEEHLEPVKQQVGKLIADMKNRPVVRCKFGPPAVYGETDAIGQVMKRLEVEADAREFARIYPDEWAVLRNKVINHAIKGAMIDAIITGEGKNVAAIDCLRYFERHARLVISCYFAYYLQVQPESRFGETERKVLKLLRRDGSLSRRDIQRSLSLYGRELQDLMENLEADNIIETILHKPARGPATVHWRLRDNPQ